MDDDEWSDKVCLWLICFIKRKWMLLNKWKELEKVWRKRRNNVDQGLSSLLMPHAHASNKYYKWIFVIL